MSCAEVENNAIVVSNDGETPCLKINNMKEAAKYYEAESFNIAYADYMADRLDNDMLLTESDNHMQACNALNALYVDLDYHMPLGTSDPETRNQEMVTLFMTRFLEVSQIDKSKINNLFVFVPERLLRDKDGLKAGGHCFLYMSENYTKPAREEIYNHVKQVMPTVEFARRMEQCGCPNFIEDFDKIFDKGPLCSASVLLPFAEKKNAQRHYVLINPADIDISKQLLMPTIHRVVDEIEEASELSFEEDEEIDIDDDGEIGSNTGIETLKFIESLKYLAPYHPFWTVLEDHNKRLRQFISPLVDWIAMCQFISDPWNVEEGRKIIPIEVAKATIPLIKMSDPKKSIQTLVSDIRNVCMLKYGSETKGGWKFMFSELHSEAISCFKDTMNDGQKAKAIINFCKNNKAKFDDLDTENAPLKLYKELRKVKRTTIFIWANFAKFIKFLMNGMTEEIRPFRQHDKISLKSNIRDCSFDEIVNKNNPEFKTYHKTIRRWLRMFICMTFYNELDVVDSIRTAIECFVRHFVFNIKTDNKKDPDRPWIYNIRQSIELQANPYNQWIPDKSASLATSWFGNIYCRYVEDTLQSYKKVSFISPFVDMLKITTPVVGIEKRTDITVPTNFKNDINRIRKNILLLASNRPNYARPAYQDPCGNCNRYPCRNGHLEFVTPTNKDEKRFVDMGLKVGDYIFHYNNYDIYMDGFTNTPWHDDYDTVHNPIFKRIQEMFTQIYPDPAVKKYVMMMYAQTLHSYGTRDQIHQFYGQGAEGKSVMNTAVGSMLGEKSGEMTTMGGYPDKTIINPYGLATTVEAEALLQANKSTHQSGGTAELVHKRFASVQEPEVVTNGTNMNVSTGKKITGDASLSARRLYENPIIYTPKLYITIQTNTLLGYSEPGLAVDRRYGVVPHNAKFVSAAIKAKTKKAKYVHIADPSLSDNLRENPYYWEALLRVLLPYAQEFLREGYSGLSDVPKPESMDALMEISKSNSSGLVGWFAKHITEKQNNALSIQYIVDYVFKQNRIMELKGESSIFDIKDRTQPKSVKTRGICSYLTSQYGNIAMFKLRPEFIDPRDFSLINNAVIDGNNVEIADKMTVDESNLEKYFEEYAVQNLEMVNNGKKVDLRTIFIVGYDFIEESSE